MGFGGIGRLPFQGRAVLFSLHPSTRWVPCEVFLSYTDYTNIQIYIGNQLFDRKFQDDDVNFGGKGRLIVNRMSVTSFPIIFEQRKHPPTYHEN